MRRARAMARGTVLAGIACLALLCPPAPGAAAAEATGSLELWESMADRLFDRIGRDQGLPSDIVTALAEDATGFVWIGTSVGLARFDGHGFRIFQPDPGDPSALPDGYVNALHVDGRGRLWVATNNGGLARYVPETEGFARYPAGPGGLGHATVYAVADDPQGRLWVGTRGGLDLLDAGSGDAARQPAGGALPAGPVQTLLADRAGNLWIGGPGGLAVRRAGSDEPGDPATLPGLQGFDRRMAVMDLYQDSAGRVWIGGRDGTVTAYDGERGRVLSFDLFSEEERGGRPQVRGIVEVAPDLIWIASDPGGLTELDVATGRLRPIRSDPAVATSLGGDAVRSLLRDRAGLVWVGGWGSGVSRHNPANRAVRSLIASPYRKAGPSEGQVRSVLATGGGPDGGEVWLGTETRGIDIIDLATGRQRALRTVAEGGSLPRATVMAMAEDARGRVWIGTQLGLARTDRSGGAPEAVPLPLPEPSPPIFRILADGDALWLAGDGLMRLETRTGSLRRHLSDADDPETLSDDRVRALAPAPGGRLWVGTHRGLNLFDPRTGKARRVLSNPFDPRSLPHNYVTALLHDAAGRLWVGTLGGGIGILERDDGEPRFRRLDRRDGLPADSVSALERDALGRIWAYTENGLAVIDPARLSVRVLDSDDGVAIRGPWIGASAALPDGHLLFGGRDGLTVVRPTLLSDWEYEPPLVVTEARVGSRPVPADRFNAAALNPLRQPPPLVVGPADAGFDLSFAALDYAAPGRLRYSFRLEGFDKGWREADGIRRTVAYTNLPPGDYRLMLRGSNKEGRWSAATLTVPVRVLPAWYETVWVRGLAALAALGAVGGLVQARTRVLRRREQELAAEVAARTVELTEANAKLERLASLDPLTGLLNRRRFMEMAEVEMERSRRYRHPFSLMMIDLDHFKAVNDTHGHAAGDEAIRAAAARLQASIRKTDVPARFGGEEFILLLPETPADVAHLVAERIRRAVMLEPVRHEDTWFPITASLGVAEWVGEGESLAHLIERADAALYAAKQGGRNRTVLASPATAAAE
ncbi:MAG TPA: diguanylate cyclase [Azospirillaceae bacterium]|nr:diguanylate cyclase [Azospirillaceae bacterium]